MAKKIVRGITDVKTINNQDFDTNNVNDLLSDGQYNYIHRKKGKTEEYHNLTDNIKTISSDNTELLSVTNYNKTTNTATLHPKHDAQKEQVLESTRNTITIHHGTNGTDEKTTVDTNPQKVLEHENLISDSEYITLSHQTGENATHIQTAALKEQLDTIDNYLQQLFQAIAAGGGSATSTIKKYYTPGGQFEAYKHVVQSGGDTLTTFVFECFHGTAEHVITGELKEELDALHTAHLKTSNGAITFTYDGTTMKLINSKSTEDGNQQGTFTFHEYDGSGGGTGGGTGGGDISGS